MQTHTNGLLDEAPISHQQATIAAGFLLRSRSMDPAALASRARGGGNATGIRFAARDAIRHMERLDRRVSKCIRTFASRRRGFAIVKDVRHNVTLMSYHSCCSLKSC